MAATLRQEVDEIMAREQGEYDERIQRKVFDDTKMGVKGLFDAGIDKVPKIFIRPKHGLVDDYPRATDLSVPLIDFAGIDTDPVRRKEVADQVRDAAMEWGFFNVINHGISQEVMDEVIQGGHRFFNQDVEERKKWYTRDPSKRVIFSTNFDLYTAPVVNWRDTLECHMFPHFPESPDELPHAFSEILMEYGKQLMQLGKTTFGFLSEGLGLKTSYLEDIGCAEGLSVAYNYYPPCPHPDESIGAVKHSDTTHITILLQDDISALQVLYKDQWVDVPAIRGALSFNAGYYLQLVSNAKYPSVEHRALATTRGPRISVPGFFTTDHLETGKVFGPIKELTSEDDPPKYRGVTVKEFTNYLRVRGVNGVPALEHYKL